MRQPRKLDIRVVLFDVGGVLVELSGIEMMTGWLGSGITLEEMWLRWLRSSAVRRFETGRGDADEFGRQVTREFGLDIEPAHFLEAFAGWPLGLYPGVMQMLARIPAHYQLALLSNSNALHWPRMLSDMGLEAAFEHRFASHLMGKIKPDRDAFEHVVATLGCLPQQVLFLDDNRLNVEAAINFGMHAVRVVGPLEAQRALVEFGIIERDVDAHPP